MSTVSVESEVLVKPASRLTLCCLVPLENVEMGDVGKSSPELRVQDDEVLAVPWAPYWAVTEAEAGPAGSHVRAAAAPTDAATATERRTDLDLNMNSPVVV
jgi:hypothetical protein